MTNPADYYGFGDFKASVFMQALNDITSSDLTIQDYLNANKKEVLINYIDGELYFRFRVKNK